MNIIDKITANQLNKSVPEFRVGDTIVVGFKVKEGVGEGKKERERIQNFEGIVIAKKGKGTTETVTVRKMVTGIGVERIFPIHSPKIESITVTKKGKVRRSKLYFLRDRVSQYKIKERN